MTALQRKENTEKFLSTFGIILEDNLPPIEEEHNVTLRSPQQIAQRILILTYLSCVASDPSLQQEVMMFLIREKLWDQATHEEKSLFHKTPLSEDDLTWILWRGESIWMLLWTIHKVDQLGLPEKEVNLNDIFPFLPGFLESTDSFVNTARTRSVSEILDQSDLMFRLNWALRQTQGEEKPALKFNPGIAYERYFSINWVMRADTDWDA